MRHAICALSAVPVRKEPSDKSEMTTQLLFGDACTVIADDGGWSRIRNKADGYEGWVTAKMLEPMTEETYAGYDMSAAPVVTCGMAFAAESCKSMNNNIPAEFAQKLKLEKEV